MLGSIKKLTNDEIIKIIELNLFEQIRFYGNSSRAQLIDNENIIKFQSRIPLPFFNCVIYYNLDSKKLKKQINDFIKYGRSRKTSLLWLSGPSSKPDSIGAFLEENSFKYDDHMISMAIEIPDLKNDLKNINDFEIELVDNRKKLEKWVHTCLKGFNENGKNFSSIYEFEKSLGYHKTLPWVRFTGIKDGEAIATSAIFMGSEVAGVDNVTTLPGWRNKGVGASMVVHALKFSQSIGYNVGVLQASDMGYSLYQKLGFKKFYEFKEYIWKYDAV
jgi:ribosomal protein S18 acetylase RimI-like enzyme